MSDPIEPLINLQERQARRLQELKQNLKFLWKARARAPSSSAKDVGHDVDTELDLLIEQVFNVKQRRK